LLRAERRNPQSKYGDLIESYIVEGKIVPVEITIALLKKAMVESGRTRFLIDGFPRNYDNLQGWQSVMGSAVDVECVLFYDTDEDEMARRILQRSATSGRSDDNEAAIRKRLRTFRESTMPVVEDFDKHGKVRRVSSSPPVDIVFEDTRRVIEPIVKEELLAYNQALLNAIEAGDWALYSTLCPPSMTAFEAESRGALVEGTEFHKYYFDLHSATEARQNSIPRRNIMAAPHVRLLGPDAAIVSYERLVQGPNYTTAFSETRVWHCEDGIWKNVHFHRSPVSASARASPVA
jgi:UMP-CMP kinase